MICWVLGAYPTSVYTLAHAHVDVINALNDVDTVVISMKFADGTLATIDLSRYAAYGYDQRLEVSLYDDHSLLDTMLVREFIVDRAMRVVLLHVVHLFVNGLWS